MIASLIDQACQARNRTRRSRMQRTPESSTSKIQMVNAHTTTSNHNVAAHHHDKRTVQK